MNPRDFALTFATITAVAAVAGGVGALVVGQSHHAAPTQPVVREVGAAQTPASTKAVAPAAPAPVVEHVVTRTVVIKTAAPAPAVKPSKPVKEPKVTEPASQPAPAAAVEVDPTPDPAPAPNYDQPEGPWQKGGTPTSMNGQPDPKVGTVTPTEPTPGTLPMHPVSE